MARSHTSVAASYSPDSTVSERPRQRNEKRAAHRGQRKPRRVAGKKQSRVRNVAGDYQGRLELTWTNKHLRLLGHENGSYEWVPASDYRVAETRLLLDAGTTGETHSDRSRAKDNLLIRGDALHALSSLTGIPEFQRELVGKVKLVYIDPPFNTQQAFEQYDDALEHSVWLTMMRDRLLQIRKLVADDGTVWVHLDDAEGPYCRVLMDEIFGRDSYVGTVVWQKRSTRENRAAIGSAHDSIHVYCPRGYRWSDVRNRLPRDAKSLKQYRNPNNDPRGDWRTVPIDAQGYRPNQMYDIVGPTGKVFKPPKGRCWSMIRARFDEHLEAGRIWWGADGKSRPMLIRYLDEDEGLVPWTWWPAEEVGHNGESKRELMSLFPESDPFATPKPERLMERIIHIATNPGDIVLDCFAGSGTTAAVAHKMGRRWVTVEWSRETLETFTGPRLEKVVAGADPVGVTESTGWKGGGGFRVLDVSPSMFEEYEGQVLLAEWAVGSALNEAVAAQFGFEYDPELLPFAGRKGRVRLAVVDGLVNEDVARLLLAELPENERLCLCGTMLDADVRELLRAERPGSTLRKVPESILADYRQGQLWWDRHAGALQELPETEEATEESEVPA